MGLIIVGIVVYLVIGRIIVEEKNYNKTDLSEIQKSFDKINQQMNDFLNKI